MFIKAWRSASRGVCLNCLAAFSTINLHQEHFVVVYGFFVEFTPFASFLAGEDEKADIKIVARNEFRRGMMACVSTHVNDHYYYTTSLAVNSFVFVMKTVPCIHYVHGQGNK